MKKSVLIKGGSEFIVRYLIDELHPLNPLNPYRQSKSSFENTEFYTSKNDH